MEVYPVGLVGLAISIAIAFAAILVVLVRRLQPTKRDGQPLRELRRADSPRLIATEGSLEGREFPIPPSLKGLTIGRDPSNDVVVPADMLVSRNHALIMLENGQYVLYDRNSVNGVYVNNQRVARHVLSDGDLIQICNCHFRFVTGAAPLPSKSPPSVKGKESPMQHSVMDSMRLRAQTYFEGHMLGQDLEQSGTAATYERYILEKELGRGGMSVVYKAFDAQGAPLAIKVLDVTDKYLMRKFVQESQIGAALRDHPNIRTVYHLGRCRDNRLYLVMEYIDGVCLRQVIDETKTDAEIVRIIGQTCDALHYAHRQNIVHRDVKPENILIDNQGVVKVTDFGIAKLTSSVTVTSDRIVGTPEYLSPEQARGQQRILPSSDIYSLGIVLYEMLAGRPPFTIALDRPLREATLAVLSDHIRTKPTPPSQIQSRTSKHLERVALKALEKDAKRRYPTARAVRKALGFQSKAMIPSPPRLKVAYIVIAHGSRVGVRIRLRHDVTVLGREQIAPEDLQISRNHISIVPRGDQLWLEDTSLNGTWVNGERVYGEIPIIAGDEIAVGEHILRVEM